jgi:monofunctional biosynthetic peptidoglycan transglycosylase
MIKKKGRKIKLNSRLKYLMRLMGRIMIWFAGITFIWVLAFRFINPPFTFLMLQRGIERKMDGKEWKVEKKWVDLEDISDNLK